MPPNCSGSCTQSTSSTRSPYSVGDQRARGLNPRLSSAIVCLHYKQSRTQGINRDNRSSMLSYEQPRTPRPTASQFVYNGCPDIAMNPGTRQQIGWLKRRLYQAKPTRFPPCYHARGPTSGRASMPNGKVNGKNAIMAATARSTTHCRPNTRDSSMETYLETELTSWRS